MFILYQFLHDWGWWCWGREVPEGSLGSEKEPPWGDLGSQACPLCLGAAAPVGSGPGATVARVKVRSS